VPPERVEPSECFFLKAVDPQSAEKQHQPKETRVKMDELSFTAACVGEERPLTLIYSWKTLRPPIVPSAARRTKTQEKRYCCAAPPPLIEEQSILTSPTRISSKELACQLSKWPPSITLVFVRQR